MLTREALLIPQRLTAMKRIGRMKRIAHARGRRTARVFDVAFRGESARTPGPQSGGGLGLSIARGIVEAHSGQIAVRNACPGCQFLIRLPLARPGAPAINRTVPRRHAGAMAPGGPADPGPAGPGPGP